MNKKFLFMLSILFLGVGVAFAAGEFDNVNKVIENADAQVQTTSGVGLKTIMAWLPVIAFGVGVFMGYRHAKKQGDQQEDSNKVAITMGIAGIVGAIVGVLIDALIGAGLMQDSAKGLQVLKDYWLKALGL